MTPAATQPRRLLVVYDETCGLCVRCRQWLESQVTHVPIDFLPAGSQQARERLAPHLPWVGYELVVVSDRGDAWIGPAGFLMCLWATRDHRHWSYRLSGRTFAPMAERFFHAVSTRRQLIGHLVGPRPCRGPDCAHGRP